MNNTKTITTKNLLNIKKKQSIDRTTVIRTTLPRPDELNVIRQYKKGHPDYQPVYSQDEVLKKLGLIE